MSRKRVLATQVPPVLDHGGSTSQQETDCPNTGTLGEYAAVVQEHNKGLADADFPEVAAHLKGGCWDCFDAIQEIVGQLADLDSKNKQ